ncbi:MAG: ribosomal protein S18-alanine N-acetyltransferase [Phototrophicaceae bacterium]
MLTIRRFNFIKDIRAIMTIEKSVFGRDAFPAPEFLYLQQIGKGLFLVAMLDENIVGYISAYTQGNKGYIASIAVAIEFRRRGIAKRLMQEIMNKLATVNYIELHVRQSNEGAITFYKGLDFEISDIEEDYYPDESAFIMTLHIE